MSFQQGLSGLNATSTQLDVIGNNIANASTTGAKSSTTEFSAMYAAAISGASSSQVGIGVQVQTVAQNFTQGSITTTGSPLDLAINGGGFFQVATPNDPTQYTRNGQFNVDANGYIVNAASQQLMGYAADSSGNIAQGQTVPLQLPTGNVAPQSTSKIAVSMNLDSADAVTAPTTGNPINYSDSTTYNNATSVTVYDAQGNSVPLTYYFQKSATDTWNVYASANGVDVGSGGAATPAPITTMTFPSSGTAPTSPSAPVSFTIPANATAGTQAITATLDLTKTTEYGSPFAVSALTQDGFSSGQLTGVAIDSSGVITANYSNGQSKPAGQVALANFRNAQGLQPAGNNNWSSTIASGTPVVGAPSSGSLGALQSGALESSNVDLTNELVNLITAQRVYQANAQTIKAQDTILQTLVNGL
jgi:flagellar hook protein FlgE